MLKPTNTPWGRPDHVKVLMPGVIEYQTPSHGGVYVASQLIGSMPPALSAIGDTDWENPGNGGAGLWFGEDCATYAIILTWPELFPGVDLALAEKMLQRCYPSNYNLWKMER